jgi:DNA helicase II / ATP-dependent DNA helicase PcrA
MRVARLTIENFRGIKNAVIFLPKHGVLIGDNNTGKTTILEALDLVLGPDRLNRLPPIDEHDFFRGEYMAKAVTGEADGNPEASEPAGAVYVPPQAESANGVTEPPRIKITVTIADLTDEQKSRFGNYVEFWDSTTEAFFDEPNPAGVDPVHISEALRVTFHGWYNEEEDDFEGQTFFTRSLTEADRLEPFSKRHRQVCGFLYLRSHRTGSRALSLERGSLLDIILRLKEVRPQMWEDTLTTLSAISVAGDPNLGISAVLESIDAALKKYVPKEWGVEPHLKVSNLTREHLRKVITAFIASGEGNHAAPYYRQGTGTINMLVLAMLSQIAEGKQNVIFAMEEPETAIPPYAQKRIVHEVRKLASQTLFTSHSPYVLEEFTFEDTVVMEADGHLLVTGGPGSGKTTVSILKAAQIVEHRLRPGQKILFLSFARATVSRVVEAIEFEQKIPVAQKRRIDVETYHSFFWRILKAHGYLVGLPRRLSILTPPAEAVALSEIRSRFPARNLTVEQKAAKADVERAERTRLATAEGRVCFDLFAPCVGAILHGSERIRKLLAIMYPVIILDEFQDTNAEQWRVVQALGEFCTLVTLADPEQRIYDWIGADPQRLNHFRETFVPTEVDLSTDNHRSAGTDIAVFGNDVLKSSFRQDAYVGVRIYVYPPKADQAFSGLVTTAYKARKRLVDASIKDWSLAILVPTKKLTRLVSDVLRQPPAGMAALPHSAIIEIEAAILGAEIIALLLQPAADSRHFQQMIDLMCSYFQGKGGDEPTKAALKEAARIRRAYEEMLGCQAADKTIRKNSILVNVLSVYAQTRALSLTGDPEKDWRAMRQILEDGACKRLKEIAEEVRNIRVLDRGTQLRQALSQDWRDNGGYLNALSITRQAFMQEHFSTNARPETGIVVMNMHKAKGKQFDEVIVFEGWPIKSRKGEILYNPDRIVRFNSRNEIDDQARQNFRVSVTRGRRQTTILTPEGDPCILLVPKNSI